MISHTSTVLNLLRITGESNLVIGIRPVELFRLRTKILNNISCYLCVHRPMVLRLTVIISGMHNLGSFVNQSVGVDNSYDLT